MQISTEHPSALTSMHFSPLISNSPSRNQKMTVESNSPSEMLEMASKAPLEEATGIYRDILSKEDVNERIKEQAILRLARLLTDKR